MAAKEIMNSGLFENQIGDRKPSMKLNVIIETILA
jgi:hypothetical protein